MTVVHYRRAGRLLETTISRIVQLLQCMALAAVFPALIAGGVAAVRADESPVIAGASDLQFALEEIAAEFHRNTGHTVRLALGSSGNFARQIRQGAPFQVFLSADEEYVFDLARAGFAQNNGMLYAIGRIVIMTSHGSALRADGELADLKAALADGRVRRFALANPEHAPYGKRAEEALRHEGIWDAVLPKLVYGENVSQAAQFATSANTDGGIIAYSLALSPRVAMLGTWALIPETWHSPLRQRMVLLNNANAVAERFFEFVQEPGARAILRRYGFLLPGEEL